jgi:CheY-like chemotaxis protein
MDDTPSERMRPKVLVLDDEHLIADTLRIILEESGFEATAVYSGRGALEMAQFWPPDVFLGDVVMPGINGIEAAVRIHSMYPACRILLLSGQAVTNDLLSEARLGGMDFELLSKPIHPVQLLLVLRSPAAV